MFFNLFVKRSNPAAQSLSIALNLVHVLVRELVGNWVRFLLTHNVLGLKILHHSSCIEPEKISSQLGFADFFIYGSGGRSLWCCPLRSLATVVLQRGKRRARAYAVSPGFRS